jgi:hypothetical protein
MLAARDARIEQLEKLVGELARGWGGIRRTRRSHRARMVLVRGRSVGLRRRSRKRSVRPSGMRAARA